MHLLSNFPEVQCRIFSFFPCKDQMTYRLTCKEWKHLLEKVFDWTKLYNQLNYPLPKSAEYKKSDVVERIFTLRKDVHGKNKENVATAHFFFKPIGHQLF